MTRRAGMRTNIRIPEGGEGRFQIEGELEPAPVGSGGEGNGDRGEYIWDSDRDRVSNMGLFVGETDTTLLYFENGVAFLPEDANDDSLLYNTDAA